MIQMFDLHGFWTWFLLFVRLTGVFTSLPGVGTEEVPITFRATTTLVLALAFTMAGANAEFPKTLAEGGLMIGTEFLLGYLLGAIPLLITGALAVAGQVSAGAIGLGQATMIDPSLGEHVSVLSRLQAFIATSLFLIMDGHHAVLRAAAYVGKDVGVGMFRPGVDTTQLLLARFVETFELAIVVAGPVIVTLLVTQFVLGLVTKFVPQVNVFIISLPLTIGVGLFIIDFSLPTLIAHLGKAFGGVEESAAQLMFRR